MRQAPIVFSRGAFLTALSIVVAFIVFGIGGTWLTIVQSGGSLSAMAAVQQGRGAAAPPRAIEGLYQTLINRDETTASVRRSEMQRLSSYGWVDRAHRVVHIPIDRAMRLVAGESR